MRRLLLLNAHGLDLLTTLWAIAAMGIGGEANPAVRAVYVLGGPPAVALVKVAGVGVFARFGQRHRTLFTFGIWIGLTGALLNALSLGIYHGMM
jgi:hypothetical protein